MVRPAAFRSGFAGVLYIGKVCWFILRSRGLLGRDPAGTQPARGILELLLPTGQLGDAARLAWVDPTVRSNRIAGNAQPARAGVGRTLNPSSRPCGRPGTVEGHKVCFSIGPPSARICTRTPNAGWSRYEGEAREAGGPNRGEAPASPSGASALPSNPKRKQARSLVAARRLVDARTGACPTSPGTTTCSPTRAARRHWPPRTDRL